jgi:uncharacterized protein YabN with tetrapyrrole methylase and pyrophosphatase domain
VVKSASGSNGARLVVVGTGIRAVGQLTTETIAWMRHVDRVLYVTADPVAAAVIQTLNPRGAESLMPLYSEHKPRGETHREIVEAVLTSLRQGLRVCLAVYGHPGVLVVPTHEAVRRARAEGFPAQMLPAVSAEDCLIADLGIDEVCGRTSYEATDFLLNARVVDPASHLILWQVGGLCDPTHRTYHYDLRGLPQLTRKLLRSYGPSHVVTLYQAAMLPGVEPLVRSGPLYALPNAAPSPDATLYVPPLGAAAPDPAMRQELGVPR